MSGRRTLRVAALAALAALTACARAEPPARPPIVVFLVDTLRADRLGAYGCERPTSPAFDAFAAGATLFEAAYAPAPWTLPSTASLLTGRHPLAHGAGLHGPERDLSTSVPTRLRDDVPTLAERLAVEGYRCEAVVSNPYVGFGCERGFERFDLVQTEGAEVVDRALARLAVEGDRRPPFLLVHLMDCHDPLLVPDEYALAVAGPGEQPSVPPIWSRTFDLLEPEAALVEARLRMYDAAVRYVDRQFERLLAGLAERGLAERAVVVFTSDHGEELYDSLALAQAAGYTRPSGPLGLGHGHTLFREVVRVPLAIDAPGLAPRRVGATARLEDVAPTLLELAGATPDGPPLDGRSLAPWLAGGSLPPAPAFTAGIAYGQDRRGVVTEAWALVRGGAGEAAVLLPRDGGGPGASDASAAHPEVLAELGALLEAAAALERAPGAAADVAREDRARLEAVGYLERR